ncbi:iron-dependent repressor [Streptococcus dysgalactiae subsp. dysgalactiae]|uniref:Manganese transport regulator n=1 Tax=Streptococcus dysgalactiae subsp. dysgalactiae TaxID=99822 RepID=A0A380JXR3_STRDY|nr:metal-dependent transcriptional regulator [Streptococcus dysgalactiae]SUN51172.1 iron-dependent repressor [Streptococcus dysgalactiae subsp. dysgalactiae]
MTPNKEDYLKCIYEIGEQESKISNKMVAEKMQVSAPAVSEMIKKMISQDWIVKEKAKGYLLTDKGQVLVANLYRKHRLIEVFLIHQLGYNAQEVHQEAEVLEHTVSDTFIDRLDETLGFPTFCPHGGTIPRNGQPLVEINHTTLNTVTDLGRFRLSRIHDQFDLIQYLESHGLKINTELELTQIDTFAKTYTIQYLDKELIIPENIAKQLYVTAL